MRAEIHCHSMYSKSNIPWDGLEEPREIVRQAKKIGLGAVAITDHDDFRSWKDASEEADKQGIIFIPGIEVSSGQGHVLALGINEDINPLLGIGETVDRIREQGAVAVAAHPYDVRGYGLRERFTEADAVEVFNALSVDHFSNWVTMAKAKKTSMPKTSGSDAHSLSMIGRAAITAEADDLEGLLKAIRNGRMSIRKEYVLLEEMKAWNRARMINAYMDVIRYIDERYGKVRAWALKSMMRRFILSRNPAWDIVARAGLLGVMGYSMLKSLSYY